MMATQWVPYFLDSLDSQEIVLNVGAGWTLKLGYLLRRSNIHNNRIDHLGLCSLV